MIATEDTGMAPARGIVFGVIFAVGWIMDDPPLAPAQIGYRRPPKAVTDVLDAPPPPAVVVTPTRGHLLLVQGVRYPAVADVAAPMLRLAGLRINPQTNGPPPIAPPVPPGPVVQESEGKAAPVRTFQDLLQNPHDEALFDYYAVARLATVDVGNGRVTPLGQPGVFAEADPSPDGRLLLVERVHRPYSYLYPVSSFPHDVEIWDRSGNVVHT